MIDPDLAGQGPNAQPSSRLNCRGWIELLTELVYLGEGLGAHVLSRVPRNSGGFPEGDYATHNGPLDHVVEHQQP